MLFRYPNILSRGRPLEDDGSGSTSFTTYLRGELETYSDRTLELLHGDIRRSAERGENWAVQTYTQLFKELDTPRSTRWKRDYTKRMATYKNDKNRKIGTHPIF